MTLDRHHEPARLRNRRQSARLTTEQVCRATGISRALLYRYESGEVVKLEVLEKLALLYETSTSALLGLGNEHITQGLVFPRWRLPILRPAANPHGQRWSGWRK